MHKKTMTWMIALTLFAGGSLAACGSDSDGGSSTEAPAATAAGDSGDSGSGSTNADVQQYCDDAKALAEELKAVMADPTKGDFAALSTKATELTTSAAQLASANAADAEAINACSKQITDAVAGG